MENCQTVNGVSPDQQTARLLTFCHDEDEAEIHIHTPSGTGVYIRVPWEQFCRLKTHSDGEIAETESGKKRKVLQYRMDGKQVLYIHTVEEIDEEGSGWAIYVSRDDLVQAIATLDKVK